MKAATSGALGALLFAGIGVAVALGVALPQRASATHTTFISWVEPGLIGNVNCSPFKDDPDWGQYWIANSNPCWHDDTPGEFTAIDYTVAGGTTPGASVYLYYLKDFQHFEIVNIPPNLVPCTGVAAALYEDYFADGYERGTVQYLHIDPAAGVIGSRPTSGFKWLGNVSSSQPGCAWTGPNLHQSADTPAAGTTPFNFNRYGDPTDEVNFQEHTIYWDPAPSDTDDDNDSYTDAREILMTTDPRDRCGDTTTAWDEQGPHYNEDISPWPPDFDDSRIVNITDTIQVLPPIFGSSVYNPDTTGDGINEYTPRRDIVPESSCTWPPFCSRPWPSTTETPGAFANPPQLYPH